jgi:hypothetical protein
MRPYLHNINMRKIWLLGLLLVSLLSACDNDDNEVAPGERPDERLNKLLTDYKAQLVGAEHGWKATLFPAGGAGYSFLFRFSENDRVTTVSDINAAAAAPLESTYRLKAVQRPSLLFDTYTYLHVLADPDATKSGGDWGQGKYSDFEFSFDRATPDSITLTGNYNGSRLVLVRATAEEAGNYITRINENARAFEGINSFSLYFKQLVIGGQAIDMSVNTNLRTITFTYGEGGEVKTVTTGYYYTPEGVRLLQPLTSGGQTITMLNALQFEDAQNRIRLTVNGVAATIQEASKPAKVDPQAAQAFYSPPNGEYWISLSGFTVEGTTDAYNITSIANLAALTFFTKVDPPYDGLIFFTTDDQFFGPAFRSRITSDGRIVFTYAGEFGTTPEQAAPMVQVTRDQFVIPEGYYVIRTGTNTFDLVSAKDAKVWISFQ